MTYDALLDFPTEMVPDSKDKAAYLTNRACNDAAEHMLELSKMLPSAPAAKISKPYLHATLALEAVNGDYYTLDMGGGQFGQHRALVPFQNYVEEYEAKVAMIHPRRF
ncbi:hypothetical protein DOTSEDRAFT_25385 [Dothistroma septosporum NZE10]|uniref:Uncharacterized protein n=1 Tax=Dothistroma septosporum (strain NZE10 / CBS 128990) TaxID=675120 RepID=M2WN56_DOTSN|nr:hypothetical protein DOTSEDRAFT_25385 [Dothistroma septosporum NZE10]